MVIFGVVLQWSFRKRKWSSIGCERGKPSLLSMRSPSALVCTPANWMPLDICTGLTPSSPLKKSKCHHERRNSPSVAHCRPTSCCFLTTFSISASSISFNTAADIVPAATFARASLRRAGRRKLPTWSARDGGLVRCLVYSPFSYRLGEAPPPPPLPPPPSPPGRGGPLAPPA